MEPALMVVTGDAVARQSFERDLSHRFGADYQILVFASPREALQRIEELKQSGTDVPIIFADRDMTGMDGLAFLTAIRYLLPSTKRVLLIDFQDRDVDDTIVEGTAFDLFDRVLTRQGFPAEEWLYPTVAEFLADWSRGTNRPRFEALRIIGEQWNPRSHEMRDVLGRNNVSFGFYDAESDDGRRLLAEAGLDSSRLPVVISFGGQTLVDPSNEEIAGALGARIRPEPGPYDLAVVGGGPAGLSAAVYGASEGLRTLLLEPVALGGQAGTSSMIRNYLGFPEGVNGARLAYSAAQQAAFFGAIIVYDEAVGLRASNQGLEIRLEDGGTVTSGAVVIATGVTYRRLDIPALSAFVGSGVYYGSSMVEARALRGQEVFIVGAGNSAGQAAVHLATEASRVTMLVRGDSLGNDMSEYLVKLIDASPSIVVRTRTEVVDAGGSGRLGWLSVVNNDTGDRERCQAAALFILIGAVPHTDWLAGAVGRDAGGYILTGRDVVANQEATPAWPLDRQPALLETTMPGVFAVGDVRRGAIKRVATAVGDGALAVRLTQEYLADQLTRQ